jgi:hypothetical protein
LKPLTGATEEQLEGLLFLVSDERKHIATDHRYRDGEKFNGVVAHVNNSFIDTRKRNRQQDEQDVLKAADEDCKASTEAFDRETKQREKELRDRQKEQRDALIENHQREITALDDHWKSPGKFRLYNRSSTKLTIMRRQLAWLLVQCRFREAEEVRRLVDEETREEEAESHRAMQRDYDEALAKLLARQQEELETFDEGAALQVQKYLQDRATDRKVLENRGRKIAAREEIAADPQRLWNHQQAARARAIAANVGKRPVPSAKMSRKDIKDKDVAILNLPPLASRRKSARKLKKGKHHDEE